MDADRPAASGDITQLLQRWGGGDAEALACLMPLVYDELRRLAARHLAGERPGHLLQRTALVHEAFLKLVDQRRVVWQNRAHFYGLAAQLMRRILVDHARGEGRVKRGGGLPRLPIEAADAVQVEQAVEPIDAIALDRALTSLDAIDPSAVRLVELRFFAGLTIDETAGIAGLSPTTVKRELALAKAWLYREMAGA